MVWWKEWRENRFGFLTTLFFVVGLCYVIPTERTILYEYWFSILLAFFGMASAIALGSAAVAPEVGTNTIHFLLSKPAGRAKFITAKYLIRGTEVMLIIMGPMMYLVLNDLEPRSMWMWVPPYLSLQYIAFALCVVLFIYSGAFFFSIVFRRQALCAPAGIMLMALYFSLRGMPALRKIYNLETLESDICLVILLSAVAFAGSLALFSRKEI